MDIYEEAMSDAPIEYQVYALDKTIQMHKNMNHRELMDSNEALIAKHEAKRSQLISHLDKDKIDWDKIKVIQSICDPEAKKLWEYMYSHNFSN